MADDLLTIEQFGATVKAKYPDYAEVPDAELGARMLAKFPEYGDRVTPFTRRGGMPDAAMASPEVFRTTNEKDPSGAAVVRDDPNTLGTLAQHTWTQADPGNLLRIIGHALSQDPRTTLKEIGAAQQVPYDAMLASFASGDYPSAARHLINYMIPMAGPGLEKSANEMEQGNYAAGVGDALGIGLGMVLPGKVGELQAARYPLAARPPVPGGTPRLTPQEVAANAFADAEGIPKDLATATGSRWAQAAQKRVANSFGGEGTATDLINRQQAALTTTGQRLAREVSPVLRTDREVGQALERSLIDTAGREGAAATTEYTALRALEADPQYAAEVPAPKASADATAAVAQRMRTALGYAPNTGELAELRRMAEELGALPYVKRTWNDVSGDVGKRGNAGGGDYDIVGGAAGAPVYDDILKSLRSSDYVPTRNHVERMIRDTLETGHVNEVSRAAFDVAQRRLVNDPAVSKPSLPPSAGVVPEAPPVTMGMPVALKPLQDAMRPDHARLMAEARVAPLMGSKAEAARILDRLMQAPEWVPASVADGVLGDLKTVSRADVPALRTEGQAIAAKAVQTLSQQVDEIVDQVPGASGMLARGRAATVRKFAAADVLDQLKTDPVGTFKALTGPGNTQLDLLEQVQAQAPQLVPQIGRAKLDQLLTLATERGRFQHADKLYAEWQRMGAARKALLYGDQVEALDQFFLLAKRIGENPNPSGTAHTLTALNVGSVPITWAAAKLLYTPLGVRALTRFLDADLRVSLGQAQGAARASAWANVALAAQRAGVPDVPLRYPLAADGSPLPGRDRSAPPTK